MEELEKYIISNLNEKKYNLDNKENFKNQFEMNIYNLKKHVSLIFLNQSIVKENISSILEDIVEMKKKTNCKKFKSYIIIAKTTDSFDKNDLFYIYGDMGYASFLFIDDRNDKIYYYDYWVFPVVANFKSIVREIKKILLSQI